MNENPAFQLSLSSRAALTRILNRKKTQDPLEKISSTDRHFDIPDTYLQFCLNDGGKEDCKQFLILGDMEKLNALRVHSKVRLCDETFKICASQFYQLYTVYLQIGGFYPPPYVYVLLSNKKEPTYNRFP